MSKTFKGIDVSTYQGSVDWGKVKEQIDFVIIRAGYGKNNIDNMAKQNVLGCEQNGIPFGLYWFSYAYTVEMARNEAKYLLDFVKGHTPLLPLYYDFEYASEHYANKNGVTITQKLLCDMATAFCEELENAGYYAGIYANYDFVNHRYGKEIFKKYDLWYAQWGVSEPSVLTNIWQNSDSGNIGGIVGKVDTDISYIDFPTLIKERQLNGYKPTPTFICPHGCPHCPHSKGG